MCVPCCFAFYCRFETFIRASLRFAAHRTLTWLENFSTRVLSSRQRISRSSKFWKKIKHLVLIHDEYETLIFIVQIPLTKSNTSSGISLRKTFSISVSERIKIATNWQSNNALARFPSPINSNARFGISIMRCPILNTRPVDYFNFKLILFYVYVWIKVINFCLITYRIEAGHPTRKIVWLLWFNQTL